MTQELPKPGTTVLLHQKIGDEPFEWNYNNKEPQIREVKAKVLSESKMCVLVELEEMDSINQPIKCNIPKRFFTSKGSNLKATPPIVSIPVGFNISPVDESEKEYINPLDKPEKMEQAETKLIYKKILAVMQEIKAIGKNQTATDKDFSFRGIDEIVNALHPLFQKHGIFTTTEALSHQVNAVGKTIVNVRFSFFAEDSSFVASIVCGEAVDKGEHGTAKAMSVAQRICLTQMFMIPTDDRDVLSQSQFQKALLRIAGGDKELFAKLQKEFRIKPDHLKMLSEAHKKKQQTEKK